MSLNKAAFGLVWVLPFLLQLNAAADDTVSAGSSEKKCVSDLLKSCSDREQRSSEKIDKLIADIKNASNTNDISKMKAALDSAKDNLSSMKQDHDKSKKMLDNIHKRMEALKQQIKNTRQEHEKAASLVEDADMDDAVWAY